jgi:anti-anti-sigma factor
MLRIFPGAERRSSDTVNHVTTLKLEGQIRGEWVHELRRVCFEVLLKPASWLVLDLAEVSFIDADGLELFRQLSAERVSLNNCSPFTAEQLKAAQQELR